MTKRLYWFITLLFTWLLLSWSLKPEEILAGALFSAVTVLLTEKLFGPSEENAVNPLKYLWLALYFFVVLWDILKAAVDSLITMLVPGEPLKTVMVEIPTSLTSASARSVLSLTLSLVPRSLSTRADGEKIRVNVSANGTYSALNTLRPYVNKYEKLLNKVFA